MFGPLPNTPDGFYSSILSAAIYSLRTNKHTDNFDSWRFNWDGKEHGFEFNTDLHVFYFDWFFKNHLNLFNAYQRLEDDYSKNLFLHLITYRLAGHLSVKLPLEFVSKAAEYEQYKKIEKFTESAIPLSGMFGKLKHYDFEYNGSRYIADCVSLEQYLFRKQYCYLKNGIRISPKLGDSVIDGGACTGDMTSVFSNAVGPEGNVYAFDPVAEHLEVLAFNAKQFPFSNVIIMPYGLSDKHVDRDPIILNSYVPGFGSDSLNIPLRSLDELVAENSIVKINFIKLDVEGAELETLIGAKQSIKRFRPALAISLYHKPNDFFEIIEFVSKEFPFYKLYIDHFTIHLEETVLFGAPVDT